jgi:ABC-type bacteriocin/lantibiotic exporter with double-glycine peptidase domain
MVLAYYGILKTEEELREHMRVSFSGTCNDMLAETAALFRPCTAQVGLLFEHMLRHMVEGKPVLVNYINPLSGQGHFAVAVGHTDTHLVLQDPNNGAGYEIEQRVFEERWVSGDGQYRRWGLMFH